MTPADFAQRLLGWFDSHGRRDLPWQNPPTAYRVWVSEVMLQQTQVTTVVRYFERFMRRFPDLAALAAASEDEVLHLWSGLGYYSRARNLRAAARTIVAEHGGRLPTSLEDWQALPGIGRSTAGAILSLAHDHRHPILDGNVKRVLCRFHGIETWPGETATEKSLWSMAEAHTPTTRVADYTQAIMDLGATVCRRSNPGCHACPLEQDCRARADDSVGRIPAPRPRRARPRRCRRFLVLRRENRSVMLVKRPPTGVWGGMWSFPECHENEAPAEVCRRRFGLESNNTHYMTPRRHAFTHFELDIKPVLIDVTGDDNANGAEIMDTDPVLWYNTASPRRLGIAAPVRTILDELDQVKGSAT